MSEYQVGDIIELQVKVVRAFHEEKYYEVETVGCAVDAFGTAATNTMSSAQLKAGKRLPRPLRVGDRVHDLDIGEGDDALGTIIAIDGDEAWVRDADGISWLPSVSNLTLAEESAS